MDIRLRPATPGDAEACGRIIYEAFSTLADRHGFPREYQDEQTAVYVAGSLIQNPAVFAIVAELGGRVVGSNFLDERDPIRGLGPVTVALQKQEHGIGRQLMEAALARGRNSAGIRLVQDAYNVSSMSLYAALGFAVREPLMLMTGKPKGDLPLGIEVRPLSGEDLDDCAGLCERVCGFARPQALREARRYSPYVALREGRITAYATAIGLYQLNHGVAETEEDMRALLLGAGAVSGLPLSLLVPVRRASFFGWCLSAGLKAISPMTLMSMGGYEEPQGCYFPSAMY
jgi:predicted N-acetyltransferase YhbS